MGVFPFAATVGSMSMKPPGPMNVRAARNGETVWHIAHGRHPNWPGGSGRRTRSSFSSVVLSPLSPSASCSGPASGRARTHSVERGPPWPAATLVRHSQHAATICS